MVKRRRNVRRVKEESLEEFKRRLASGEIKIVAVDLPPEEQKRRLDRFFEILLEADLKAWKKMTEEESQGQEF